MPRELQPGPRLLLLSAVSLEATNTLSEDALDMPLEEEELSVPRKLTFSEPRFASRIWLWLRESSQAVTQVLQEVIDVGLDVKDT